VLGELSLPGSAQPQDGQSFGHGDICQEALMSQTYAEQSSYNEHAHVERIGPYNAVPIEGRN
jgi:hypothetical protein